MSLHTNRCTVTTPGTVRKLHRIVFKLLQSKHPKVYQKLLDEAHSIIRADNENPFSAVVDAGLNVVHLPSPELRAEIARRKKILDEANARLNESAA
jgi:hypothetical protein